MKIYIAWSAYLYTPWLCQIPGSTFAQYNLLSSDNYEVKTAFELFYRDLYIESSNSSTATQVRSCLFNLNKFVQKNNLKKLEKN